MYITSEPEDPFDKYDEMRLHMEQLLSASITDFDIPMRIAIPLDGAGVRRVRDLVRMTRDDIFKVNRLGEKAANEIESILDRFGLSLGMDV
ncbi:DNA-directed RNA polymerase subunit alpha C-terminal domain-containing protein [Muribaculum intestinale]|uniref:DNA-directed RNA polymerase subunit alpha C-terminal domain-containing protein n=1 Tax=Muribaculum intestinale TaxID=1796646 RepID=UPI0025AF4FE2|nr:DNA-directed RNA polymerase subunit alpha C-terminal domain-containing protein [Muribaculum intestinale]